MNAYVPTKCDEEIKASLKQGRSFAVIAGAGSGKTTSLIVALEYLRATFGPDLRRDGKRVACITYTNRAVEVIAGRLEWDDLFAVSTLHSFLWDIIGRFTPNIRQALVEHVIPEQIAKKQEQDNGGQSQRAIAARERVEVLRCSLNVVPTIKQFEYNDTNFSDYDTGKLSHDDVIHVAAHLLSTNERLRKMTGQRFPYVFVDEAQDTFEEVVVGLNALAGGNQPPVIGYFGDPMQQIYDNRAGDFAHRTGIATFTKEENYRCSRSVIRFLNAFRTDIQQKPAGKNTDVEGSVLFCLVQAETPSLPRNRYSDEQLERSSARFDQALRSWGLHESGDTKYLFLARQMIARRMGFSSLQRLFTGEFASSQAQEEYEKGTHYLLRPFVSTLYPLLRTIAQDDSRGSLQVLRTSSPAFDPKGIHATRPIREMKELAKDLTQGLKERWLSDTLGDILRWSRTVSLCEIGERLDTQLNRLPRPESYVEEQHSAEKGDWLADAFFAMKTNEIGPFVEFVTQNTPFSTQHGVKGEEYPNVVVVFDDLEAAWNNYSFAKTLTPGVAGTPSDGQLDRTRKLSYVCFSRAEVNLRVVLFSADPSAAKHELIKAGLLTNSQIEIAR